MVPPPLYICEIGDDNHTFSIGCWELFEVTHIDCEAVFGTFEGSVNSAYSLHRHYQQ